MSHIASGAHYLDAQLSKGPQRSENGTSSESFIFKLMVSVTRGTRESVLEKGYGLSTQKEDATLPPNKGEMLGIVDP